MLCVFNSGITGLSTVGYQLLSSDKTVYLARTTTGVTEIVASSGIYGVEIADDTLYDKTIVWDDGEATPAFYTETFSSITYALINEFMSPYGHIIIGRGRGTTTYSDTLTDGINDKVNYVVKAYLVTGGLVDWDNIMAMDLTDGNGIFTIYLDPGDYILSIEKNGTQIGTQEITVV